MKIEHFKTYTQLHTWTGILAGLFLFICFVAGSLTMFRSALNQWALPPHAALPAIAEDKYDTLLQQVFEKYPSARKSLHVYLPNVTTQAAPVVWTESGDEHASSVWLASLDDNDQLLTREVRESAVGDFIDHIHRTAGIPGGEGHDAFGTFFMGGVAAIYFLALISGLIIFLPSWLKDIFVLRKGENRKRFWLDFHNILGISALPFHIVIACTTVVFAFHDVFYESLRSAVYRDVPMFERAAPSENTYEIKALASVQQLTDGIQKVEPGFEPAMLRFRGVDTPRASVLLGGEMEGQWIRGPNYAYVVMNPYTATAGFTEMLPSQPNLLAKFVNGFFTLHFGSFGGDFIRWVYFIMGLSGALLFLSGNILWVNKRAKKKVGADGKVEQKRSTMVLARLTVGVSCGTLIGLVMALLAVKTVPYWFSVSSGFCQYIAFYVGLLFCTGWAFIVAPISAAKHQILLFISLLVLMILASIFMPATASAMMARIAVAIVSSLALIAAAFTYIWVRKREQTWKTANVWQPTLVEFPSTPEVGVSHA